MVVGDLTLRIASTFSFKGLIPCASTSWPRNSILDFPKMHFFLFTTKPFWLRIVKTLSRSSRCSSRVDDAISMSSRYTNVCGISPKIWSISRWKSWPAFFNPNGQRGKMNKPNGVMTAVFLISSGLTGIWWYPLSKSTLLKYFFPLSSELKSWRFLTGYLSVVVWLLRRQ